MAAVMLNEDIIHFENQIYLPMVITIFRKDWQLIEDSPFKLKAPYQQLIDLAIKCTEEDLRKTKEYIKKRNLKLLKGKRDDFATEYAFYFDGYEEHRKYMNLRLRNRTEELMRVYLAQATLKLENVKA